MVHRLDLAGPISDNETLCFPCENPTAAGQREREVVRS